MFCKNMCPLAPKNHFLFFCRTSSTISRNQNQDEMILKAFEMMIAKGERSFEEYIIRWTICVV